MSTKTYAHTLSYYFVGCIIFDVTGRNISVDTNYIVRDDSEDSQNSVMKHSQLSVPSDVTQVIKVFVEIHAREEQDPFFHF